MNILNFCFDEKTEDFLFNIVRCAKNQNVGIYFVGGIVRDNILNIDNLDIDLIVDCNAIGFSKNLPEVIKIKSIHKDFATVKVEYKDITYDIASTRIETYPYSGCLPDVEKVGVALVEDVKRRDFTINSLYCKLDIADNKLTYELIDLVDGVADIKNKVLKVLHEKSYIDDPTRILRGIDFKHRFNFNFSSDDEKLISDYLENPDIENASRDRFLAVFKKVLKTNGVFEELIDRKCYKLLGIDNLEVDFKKAKPDCYFEIIQDIPVEKIEVSNELDIYKKFAKLDNISYYYYKTNDKNAFMYLKIKDIKLETTGDDLIKLGFEGKKIGDILDSLLLAKIKNPELDEKEYLRKNIL